MLTKYELGNVHTAAKMLGLNVRRLRQLRERGEGPCYVTLPSGEIRYTLEDLQAWVSSGIRGKVIHIGPGERVIPFPGSGVKVRKLLRPDSSPIEARGTSFKETVTRKKARRRRTKPPCDLSSHQEVALACLEYDEYITDWEAKFCSDILTRERSLTEKQDRCLDRIAQKILNKIAKEDGGDGDAA